MKTSKDIVICQCEMTKNNDTLKESSLTPVGSTVAVKCEDSRPWTHSTVIAHGDMRYNNRSCKVQLIKTGQLVIRKPKHIKTTTIATHQYMPE